MHPQPFANDDSMRPGNPSRATTLGYTNRAVLYHSQSSDLSAGAPTHISVFRQHVFCQAIQELPAYVRWIAKGVYGR